MYLYTDMNNNWSRDQIKSKKIYGTINHVHLVFISQYK